MKNFTGFEYLLIDVANHFGLDKKLFEERIEWARANLDNLESLIDQAEVKPLYVKAVLAIRKAQQHIPTGHLVGLDAVCSGVQIMSAITGCEAGANATGLIDPNKRADAYNETTLTMQALLGDDFTVARSDAKRALMTSFYGSKATPKEIFGEDTEELQAFYDAMGIVAPGAWELLQDLLASWNPGALTHEWDLPDGFHARVKVMQKQELRIEVDELDHASFTYEFYENVGTEKGLSNVANVVHSIDAYLLRSVHRRCNYQHNLVYATLAILESIQQSVDRSTNHDHYLLTPVVADYIGFYSRSGIADISIAEHLCNSPESAYHLSDGHVNHLIRICKDMLKHKPFEVVTIHDEFKCHPNNLNQLRYHYKEVLADLADSTIVDDILSQLAGVSGTFTKLSQNLGDKIRDSNYALC